MDLSQALNDPIQTLKQKSEYKIRT